MARPVPVSFARLIDRSASPRRRSGFSLVELLVVIAIVGLLLAILLPTLFAVRAGGLRAKSMARLDSIANWMTMYANENRGTIVPSTFDYTGNPYAGKPRSESPNNPSQGTWTDILWAGYVTTPFPDLVTPLGQDYQFDSPDNAFYDVNSTFDDNPFRAATQNSQGPNEGYPGFFAANDFFDSTQAGYRWWTQAQIRNPARSLYVIESLAGETIDPVPGLWGPTQAGREVDYRNDTEALVLFLDGSMEGMSPPDSGGSLNDLDQIEQVKKIKVRQLDR